MAESRLSRWSRLKQKGGADAREERQAQEDRALADKVQVEARPAAVKLPGGARARNFVPAMPPLAPEPEDDDDRLSRGVGHVEETPAEGAAVAPAEPRERDDDGERPLTPEEEKTVAELPALDSLTAESDLAPFMRSGVPSFIRKRAMRAMWRLNPVFGFRDGLDDYDEDFNVIDKIIAPDVGNYRVGKGYLNDEELRDMMPEEARRAFEDDADANDAVSEDPDSTSDEGAEKPECSDGELCEISDTGNKSMKTHENDT